MIIQKQKTASEMPWQKMTPPDRKHTQALSKVYQAQDNTEKAERLFSDALKNRKIISNYIVRASNSISRSDQNEKIPELLDNATSTISDELPEYVVKTPKFSLDDGEDYDDVQQLKLTAESGNKIYYTKNKKKPTTGSHKYNGPIQIEEETQRSMQ